MRLISVFILFVSFGVHAAEVEQANKETAKKSSAANRGAIVETPALQPAPVQPPADPPMAPQPAERSVPEPEKTALDKAGDAAKNAGKTVSAAFGGAAERREESDYVILGNYSPFDLLIPSKYGATLGLVRGASTSWELEYLKGSVSVPFLVEDIGSMSDMRVSLIRRSYSSRNSFNISYGLSYFDFTLHIGDDLLNRASGGNYPSLDLVKMKAIGLSFAIGNRWTFKHGITAGVDWVSIAQPIIVTERKSPFVDYTSNEQDKRDVENAMRVISYFPRLAMLKVQLGMTF